MPLINEDSMLTPLSHNYRDNLPICSNCTERFTGGAQLHTLATPDNTTGPLLCHDCSIDLYKDIYKFIVDQDKNDEYLPEI